MLAPLGSLGPNSRRGRSPRPEFPVYQSRVAELNSASVVVLRLIGGRGTRGTTLTFSRADPGVRSTGACPRTRARKAFRAYPYASHGPSASRPQRRRDLSATDSGERGPAFLTAYAEYPIFFKFGRAVLAAA